MIALLALCCALVGYGGLAPAQSTDVGYEAALRELDSRRFGAALTALEGESDPVLRRRGRIEVHYRGRRWEAVLSEAQALSQGSPHAGAPEGGGPSGGDPDAWSLWRGAAAALWLSDGERALELVASMNAAVDPSAEDAEWWRSEAERFEQNALGLLAAQVERSDALTRSRTVAVGGLLACVVALVLLARGGRATLSRR